MLPTVWNKLFADVKVVMEEDAAGPSFVLVYDQCAVMKLIVPHLVQILAKRLREAEIWVLLPTFSHYFSCPRC